MGEMHTGFTILMKPKAKNDAHNGDETPRVAGLWLFSTLAIIAAPRLAPF